MLTHHIINHDTASNCSCVCSNGKPTNAHDKNAVEWGNVGGDILSKEDLVQFIRERVQSEVSEINSILDNKVDKETGKTLTKNDLTNDLKNAYDYAVRLEHYHDNKDLLDGISGFKTIDGESIIGDGNIPLVQLGMIHYDTLDNELQGSIDKAETALQEVPNEYATKEFVNDAIDAIPPTDLTPFYTKTEIDNKSYLTEHQDLGNYATKQDLTNAIDSIPETDLTPYYTKTEIDAKGYLTTHQSLSDYATKEFVNDAIEAIPETDLSPYYTKTEIDGKGYLTAHQSLTNYATKQYVNDAIDAIPPTDLTPYYTKTQIDNKVTTLNNSIASKVATADIKQNLSGNETTKIPSVRAVKEYFDEWVSDFDINDYLFVIDGGEY